MQLQIKRALQQIIGSFQADNLDYLSCFKKSLEGILISLTQEQEIMKHMYQQQVDQLKAIIKERQQYIRELKQQHQRRNEEANKKVNNTPYKILLKTGRTQDIINNKQNIQKEDVNMGQSPFAHINISGLKENRYSLQIGPSGNTNSHKRICRIASSNIKNKIINQERLKFVNSPRAWNHQNNEMFSKYLRPTETTLNLNVSDVNANSPRFNTTRNQKQQNGYYLKADYGKISEENQIKSSSNQTKTRLCRKPNNMNRSKRGLFQRKKQTTTFETNKFKGVDISIPIKIINVSDIKPR